MSVTAALCDTSTASKNVSIAPLGRSRIRVTLPSLRSVPVRGGPPGAGGAAGGWSEGGDAAAADRAVAGAVSVQPRHGGGLLRVIERAGRQDLAVGLDQHVGDGREVAEGPPAVGVEPSVELARVVEA